MPRFAFFMERQVGIGSAAAALEPHVKGRADVVWTDVTYVSGPSLLDGLPLPKRARGTLTGYQQTGALLAQGPFDALFFLTHNPAVLRQRALAKTPTVLWTDVTPALLDAQAKDYDHAVDRFAPLRTLKALAVKRTFGLAARCIGWSEWARASFVRDYGVPEAKTLVVPPGVNLAFWRSPEREATNDLPRLLFVGGDFRRKGGDLLLEVFRAHFRNRATLDIVTRDEVPAEDGVRVHRGLTAGSQPLLELYHRADCFVLPTRGDCFSIASLEAMAASLPVITSRIGGIPDIVEQEGSGFLIRPGDGSELATALDALVDDAARRRRFGLRGRELAETRFDAEKCAERLSAALNDVARR